MPSRSATSPPSLASLNSSSSIYQNTSTASSTVNGHGGSGLRTHLLHFLPPRHALFHARVTVHELANVPLISGQFAAKWRFKHVHSKVKATGGKGKGKAHDQVGLHSQGSVLDGSSDEVSISNSNRSGMEGNASSVPFPIPKGTSIYGSGASSIGHGSGGSGRSITPGSNSALNDYGSYVPPPSPLFGSRLEVTNTRSQTPLMMEDDFASDAARGITPFVKLASHKARWEHTIDVALQMDVARDTGDLQPNEMKVTIMQNVIAGDPDAPENPRVGHIYVNLAEYVDEGPVTRQFLLRKNKTNATLKITIEVTHIGGDSSYTKPPLPKGEIMAGIAHLLEADSLADALGFSPTLGGTITRDVPDLPHPSHFRSRADRMSVHYDLRNVGLQPAPEKHTTENLIEAIFNPVPTSSSNPSPFTFYTAPTLIREEMDGTLQRERAKLRGTQIEEEDEDSVSPGLTTEFGAGPLSPSLTLPTRPGASSRQSYESSIPRSSFDHSQRSYENGSLDEIGSLSAKPKRQWWKVGSNSSRPSTPQPPPSLSSNSSDRPVTPSTSARGHTNGISRPKTPSSQVDRPKTPSNGTVDRPKTPSNGVVRPTTPSKGLGSGRPKTPVIGPPRSLTPSNSASTTSAAKLHAPKPHTPGRNGHLRSGSIKSNKSG